MQYIKVILFEDSQSHREGLALLINSSERIRCVGAFSNFRQLVKNIEDTQPDVVLMDINMPDMDGIQAVRIARFHFPDLHIIMQTVFEEDDKIIGAILAGAKGYILKKSVPQRIIHGIEEVLAGGSPMTPTVARRVLELFSGHLSPSTPENFHLTSREKEILSDLVQGYSYKMIADLRSISVFTVNAHIRNIYEKLQVHSVAEAVAKAIKQKII